jgi:hypothetical protein
MTHQGWMSSIYYTEVYDTLLTSMYYSGIWYHMMRYSLKLLLRISLSCLFNFNPALKSFQSVFLSDFFLLPQWPQNFDLINGFGLQSLQHCDQQCFLCMTKLTIQANPTLRRVSNFVINLFSMGLGRTQANQKPSPTGPGFWAKPTGLTFLLI